MIISNEPLEEVRQKLLHLKTSDNVQCQCFECGIEFSATKKKILERLKYTGRFWCTLPCSNVTKHKEAYVLLECLNCQKPVEKSKSQLKKHPNTFCSQACSATYNNKLRPPPSEEQRRKVSETLKLITNSVEYIKDCAYCRSTFMSSNKKRIFCSKICSSNSRIKFNEDGSRKNRDRSNSESLSVGRPSRNLKCKVFFPLCAYCGKLFVCKTGNRKNCSEECMKKNHSERQSLWLSKQENRKNLGRGKKSWLESSFEDWLLSRNVPFETERSFRNEELGKTYFVDFLFEHLKLIIELDGSQHRKTVEKDAIRDEYIQRVHGYKVVRVTHKEYQKQLRYAEICDLLGIPDDR